MYNKTNKDENVLVSEPDILASHSYMYAFYYSILKQHSEFTTVEY